MSTGTREPGRGVRCIIAYFVVNPPAVVSG